MENTTVFVTGTKFRKLIGNDVLTGANYPILPKVSVLTGTKFWKWGKKSAVTGVNFCKSNWNGCGDRFNFL